RDAEGRIVGDDVVAQWERALENVLAVVRAAGGGPEHIGRMTVYVTSRAEYLATRRALGELWRRLMGRHYPAMTLVEVSALVDEGARVEIEATSVIPGAAGIYGRDPVHRPGVRGEPGRPARSRYSRRAAARPAGGRRRTVDPPRSRRISGRRRT